MALRFSNIRIIYIYKYMHNNIDIQYIYNICGTQFFKYKELQEIYNIYGTQFFKYKENLH